MKLFGFGNIRAYVRTRSTVTFGIHVKGASCACVCVYVCCMCVVCANVCARMYVRDKKGVQEFYVETLNASI